LNNTYNKNVEIQQKRWEILKILRKQGKATVDELAEAIGLAPITVRHHLSILEKENLVTRITARRKIGRPYYLYILTREGNESFPKRYLTLTDRILGEIYKLMGPEMLKALFEAIGKDLAREYAHLTKGKKFDEKIEVLKNILNEEGFIVEVEPHKRGALLKIISCPFRNIVSRHPSLCFFDRTLIRELIGIEPIIQEKEEDDAPCLLLIPRRRSRSSSRKKYS